MTAKQAPDRTCLGCGAFIQVNNVYGYCTANPACRKESGRHHKKAWLGRQRAYEHLYAYHFTEPGLLKVGKTLVPATYSLRMAQRNLMAFHEIEACVGLCFWVRAGGIREEQFVHAYLAYEYPYPTWAGPRKAGEWYQVDGEPIENIIDRLNYIWSILELLKREKEISDRAEDGPGSSGCGQEGSGSCIEIAA